MVTLGSIKKPNKEGTITGFNEKEQRDIDRDIVGIPNAPIITDDDDDYDWYSDPMNDDWYEENRRVRDRDHSYVCIGCKQYLTSSRDGSYTCMNNRCSSYLVPADPFHTKVPVNRENEMSISESLSDKDNENVFVALNASDGEFTGHTGREVVYKSADSRVQHFKYRNFPKDLSLRANTE